MSLGDQRVLPKGYEGAVYIWDIDKTYLATHFSSLKGMARIPLEFAVDKMAIPGMPELLRGLRRGAGPRFASTPLYFISASPPQLRKVIEHKMLLDGVQHDGITFKDWAKTLRQFKPGRLHDHVGFKLSALLKGRLSRPEAREYLFGDDVEKDARAYALYDGVLSGDIDGEALERALAEDDVLPQDRRYISSLVEQLPARRGAVKRIFIHLERNTAMSAFVPFGPKLVPVKGAFQMGLALYALGLLDQDAVNQAIAMSNKARALSMAQQEELITDALKRKLIAGAALRQLGLKNDG